MLFSLKSPKQKVFSPLKKDFLRVLETKSFVFNLCPLFNLQLRFRTIRVQQNLYFLLSFWLEKSEKTAYDLHEIRLIRSIRVKNKNFVHA